MPFGSIPELPAGIVIDTGNQELVAQIRACREHPLAESFTSSLEVLAGMTRGQGRGAVRLWVDFAPLSFVWCAVRPDGSTWMNGGLIFHGPHDGWGSGTAPTFSVTVNRSSGWRLHT